MSRLPAAQYFLPNYSLFLELHVLQSAHSFKILQTNSFLGLIAPEVCRVTERCLSLRREVGLGRELPKGDLLYFGTFQSLLSGKEEETHPGMPHYYHQQSPELLSISDFSSSQGNVFYYLFSGSIFPP